MNFMTELQGNESYGDRTKKAESDGGIDIKL
jgi:hypothetical protein